MDQRIDDLEKNIKQQEENNRNVNSRVDNIDTAVKEVQETTKTVKQDVTREVTKAWSRELRERAAKKDNVMIYGLEEPPSTATSAAARKKYDTDKLTEVLGDIGVDISVDNDIKFCARAGAWEENRKDPRPLCIGLRSSTVREKIFSSAKNLANTNYRNLSIIPDLTHQQREEDRELIKEVDSLNAGLSEEESLNWQYRCVGMKGERVILKTRRFGMGEQQHNRGTGYQRRRGAVHLPRGSSSLYRGTGHPPRGIVHDAMYTQRPQVYTQQPTAAASKTGNTQTTHLEEEDDCRRKRKSTTVLEEEEQGEEEHQTEPNRKTRRNNQENH